MKGAQSNHTIYVTRESQKFLCTLLLHEHKNIEACKEIILAIAAPLMNNTVNSQVQTTREDIYLEQNKLLCSTLDLLISILENTLFANLDNNIPVMLEELVGLELRVKAIFQACISTKFLQPVHKLVLLSLFTKLKQGIKEDTNVLDKDAFQQFSHGLCYISMMLLSKKYIIELVRNNKYGMVYWKKLLALREFVLLEQHKYEHQAIALMASLPLFIVLYIGVCIV